jgi:hypothetical protein
MRLAKLVAAGLALGAAIGFVGALLRPRSAHRLQAAGPVTGPAAEPVGDDAVDVRTASQDHSVSAGVR